MAFATHHRCWYHCSYCLWCSFGLQFFFSAEAAASSHQFSPHLLSFSATHFYVRRCAVLVNPVAISSAWLWFTASWWCLPFFHSVAMRTVVFHPAICIRGLQFCVVSGILLSSPVGANGSMQGCVNGSLLSTGNFFTFGSVGLGLFLNGG